jgi:prepilin-type N-terminal cleavage/methylation domain-containing protein
MRTGPQRREAGRGFTLIELLLATVLMLLLISAVVFSFSSLQRGSELDEGVAQFEALLRYARAHAENTGRQVLISFEDANDPDMPGPPASIQVTWEPDPLGQPGVFERLLVAEQYVEEINRLVQVEGVSVSEPASTPRTGFSSGNPTEGENSFEDFFDFLPSIRVYPDGSSDSAEVVLSSRAEDDFRKMGVRLVGITGAIRHEQIGEPQANESGKESDSQSALARKDMGAIAARQPADVAKPATPDATGRGSPPQ